MISIRAIGATALLLCVQASAFAQTSVTTYHNDLARTGVNSQETVLNTSNVHSGSFGKVYSWPVDGQVFAQPLYLPSVTIPGQGVHNVVYIVTMNNTVYAFDADSSSSTPLWSASMGASVPCLYFEPAVGYCNYGIIGPIGIYSTPVIDTTRGAIYVVSETYSPLQTGVTTFKLHALDYTTGKEKAGSPVAITGQVPGNGVGSVGGVLTFSPFLHWQHTGLALVNGNIYFGFSSRGDSGQFHGWLFGYDSLTLRRTVIKCVSPNGYGNGIWQGGAAFSADASGNVYVQTGNGGFNASTTGGTEYGEAVLKMNALSGMAITSYFVPSDQGLLDHLDYDVAAGGTIVLPGSVTLTAPMIVAGGKDGRVFLLNSANLGGYNINDSVVQEFFALTDSNPEQGSAHYGGNVFYNNNLYFWGSGDVLKQFAFSGSSFSLAHTGALQTTAYEQSAPSMSLSSNGLTAGSAILWTALTQNYSDGQTYWPGELIAYDASNVGNQLWNSGTSTSGADYAGAWSKFTPPTIANGKVYLATLNGVINVYGLRAQ